MFLAGDQPLPIEYRFMALDGLRRGAAGDLAGRPVVAVDAANEKRLGDPRLLEQAPFAIDIDHHHDNSRFGAVNLIVAEASSTAEVLRDVFAALDVELTPEIAEALYIGARHRHGPLPVQEHDAEGAAPRRRSSSRAGADVHRIFQNIYESIEFPKLKLLARALERAQLLENGELIVSYITQRDFARDRRCSRAPPRGSSTRCARSRERSWRRSSRSRPTGPGCGSASARRTATSTSRRSPRSRRAAATGRRPASRTPGTVPEIIEFIRSEYVAARNGDAEVPPRGLEPVRARARRQAGGPVVVRARRASCARGTRRARRARRDARPVRDRAPARPPRARRRGSRSTSSASTSATRPSIDLRATTASGDLQGEPLDEHEPPTAEELERRLDGAARRGRPARSGRLCDQDRRRARLQAGAARGGGRDAGPAEHGARARARRLRGRRRAARAARQLGDVRARDRRRARWSLRRAAPHRRRARSTSTTPIRSGSFRRSTCCRSCRCASSPADDAAAVRNGRALDARGARARAPRARGTARRSRARRRAIVRPETVLP